ncbi:MAG: hypothetical protein HY204_05360 [Nitrospirae bacterium]|nr:hypothetical protein [Nitrospirota bacterium]
MLSWTRLKDDLYNGVVLLRKGMITTAVYSSQEIDRLKFRYRLQAADRRLTEAYRVLGKYGLVKLAAGRPEHTQLMKEREWSRLIQEIDEKRAELEKLTAERESFDREEKQSEK